MPGLEPQDLALLPGETCYVHVRNGALSRTELTIEAVDESAHADSTAFAPDAEPGDKRPASRVVYTTVDLGRGDVFITDQRIVFRTAVDTFAWPMSTVSGVTRSFRAMDRVQFVPDGEGPAGYRGHRAREVYAAIRLFERAHVPKWFTSTDEARARYAAGETLNVGPGLAALAGVILVVVMMLRGLWTHFTGH